LTDLSKTDCELNELGWWSNWSHLIWLDKNRYVLTSKEFEEPLFNHGGFLTPIRGLEAKINGIEHIFDKAHIAPSFFLWNSSEFNETANRLVTSGYRIIDQLSVMQLLSPNLRINPKIELEAVKKDTILWSTTYLSAFYGEQTLTDQVEGALRKASADPSNLLVMAIQDGRPVGTLAAHSSDTIVGAYCVGVVPGQQGMGVASTMLDFAYNFAKERGSQLVLQTFISDALEGFYRRRGFHRLSSKDVYVKGP